MKSTKVMLVVLSTLIVTCILVGLTVYLLSNLSYKESITNSATLFIMLFVGWIPSVIVAVDYNEHLNNK